MAQQALGAGLIVPRKRVLFGLLDADGWIWAGVKATFWLVVIIMLLGYIPDRAYYLTVNRTVQLGVLVWSPVNFCPPENESLPCPPPPGSVGPWHASPSELLLPAGRTDGTVVQLGSNLIYVGGSDGTTAQTSVFTAPAVGTGNFDAWVQGPELPQPRSDASVLLVTGSLYVIGGFDAAGAPTSTVFSLTPDPQTGDLGEWTEVTDLALLEPRADAIAIAAPDGILLIGGQGPDGVVATTWKSPFDAQGALGEWEAEQPLAAPQAAGGGAVVGDYVWIWGGHDTSGPVGAVQRGTLGLAAAEGLPENPDEGKIVQWAFANAANLPAARDEAATWSANGALYLVGGADASGLQPELYWTTPTAAGDITEWNHLEASDLPTGLAGGSAVISGPNVIIVGGTTADGVTTSSIRTNAAPQSPFFQLGIAGVTVPGLTIEGEIGQQLGYLNAAGAGTVGFIVLLLIGWAYAHPEQTKAIIARVLRRR